MGCIDAVNADAPEKYSERIAETLALFGLAKTVIRFRERVADWRRL
jgi:hypothetical protein